MDEQQTTIYCVLKEKFEKFAEQQVAIALKVIQVRLAALQTCMYNGVILKLDVSIGIFEIHMTTVSSVSLFYLCLSVVLCYVLRFC